VKKREKLTDSAAFDLRYTHLDDGPALRSWLEAAHMLDWFPMSTPIEVDNALQVWLGFCRLNSSLTATYEGSPCAVGTLFLMPYRKVAHHCLFKIIVAPEFQRRGIGTAILRNLKHLAKNFFHLELMHIEFFTGNPIEALLKKERFREFARQEHFVKQGDRYWGRILMECDL